MKNAKGPCSLGAAPVLQERRGRGVALTPHLPSLSGNARRACTAGGSDGDGSRSEPARAIPYKGSSRGVALLPFRTQSLAGSKGPRVTAHRKGCSWNHPGVDLGAIRILFSSKTIATRLRLVVVGGLMPPGLLG